MRLRLFVLFIGGSRRGYLLVWTNLLQGNRTTPAWPARWSPPGISTLITAQKAPRIKPEIAD